MVKKAELAKKLYEEGIILFGKFKLASGIESPYYIDLRKALSKPHLLREIIEAYKNVVEKIPEVDVIVGIETGSIPWAAILAYILNKPLAYVRKKPKEHGAMKLIEGEISEGKYAIVVDDVSTTGGSLLRATRILRENSVKTEYAVVFVDREQGAKRNLEKENVKLISIFTVTELLKYIRSLGFISETKYREIIDYVRVFNHV